MIRNYPLGAAWIVAFVFIGSCIILLGLTCYAQASFVHSSNVTESSGRSSPGDMNSNRVAHLHTNVDLVLVPAVVTDERNRPVLGLQKDDFSLYEGDEQRQIQSFSAEDSPISIGLILDLSNSMRSTIEIERQALAEFFKNANPEDDYFAIAVSQRPELLADASGSIETIQAKLATATPGGYTALLDAIHLGVSKLRSARYQRRVLLIISDGGDNASRYTTEETKRLVQEEDVQIYAIRVFDALPFFRTMEEKFGNRLLSRITETTGGRTISVDIKDGEKVPRIAAEISTELRNQYVLGFRPGNGPRDGRWRKIKVRVLAPKTLTPLHIRAKTGYLPLAN
jgi:Ca-activated chloride channel homolog